MYCKNFVASLIWKLIIVIPGTIALLGQAGAFAGVYNMQFHHFFTNLSNLLVVVYFWADIVHMCHYHSKYGQLGGVRANAYQAEFGTTAIRARYAPLLPKVKYAATMAITLTGLVAHFMLPGMTDTWQIFILHYLVPIATVADWIIFDPKGNMGVKDPLVWTIFPLLYLAYVFICVGVLGIPMGGGLSAKYPYPFINVDSLGVQQVAITCVVLCAAYVLLGYIYRAIDVLMVRFGRR